MPLDISVIPIKLQHVIMFPCAVSSLCIRVRHCYHHAFSAGGPDAFSLLKSFSPVISSSPRGRLPFSFVIVVGLSLPSCCMVAAAEACTIGVGSRWIPAPESSLLAAGCCGGVWRFSVCSVLCTLLPRCCAKSFGAGTGFAAGGGAGDALVVARKDGLAELPEFARVIPGVII